MSKGRALSVSLAFFLITATSLSVSAKTVLFYEEGFPSVDNAEISRAALVRSLASMHPIFVGLDSLSLVLSPGDLLILPYGSAFPADAWPAIENHLHSGNVLVLGGRPLYVPVFRSNSGWREEPPQNNYSKAIGIMYSYEAPQHGPWTLEWDVDAPFFKVKVLNPKRVFVNAGFGGRYRGLGFMVDADNNRVAAPVVADDIVRSGTARRSVFLSFDASTEYWISKNGEELIREAAQYASFGGLRLYLDVESLSLDPGDRVTGSVDVLRDGPRARLTLELLSGSVLLEKRTVDCGNSMHEAFDLAYRFKKSGLYTLRAVMSTGDTVFDQYTSGVEVRRPGLLESGKMMTAGRDYFRLGSKPFLPVGVNYFSTDPYGRAFFFGQSIGGNPYIWERDFAEMEKNGFTIVRTGIWGNRLRYLEQVSGASGQRLLGAVEAFLSAAARHNMQVIFTFFAFNPGVEMQSGGGPGHDIMVHGSNPYVDPASIEIEKDYVRSIASRFKDVPFLSYDLINEPSYADLQYIWKGNSPTGGSAEESAWRSWLETRYESVGSLATAWHTTASDLGSFENVPLPDFSDLLAKRDGNSLNVRAVDYNRFVQYVFNKWIDEMIGAIRSAGSRQIVTVGQDEGGVTNRLLNQFMAAGSEIDYTTNHTWWQDDALLWDSIVPKSINKPNLVEETGPQPVWSLDGSWRLDDMNGLGLEERKLVLAFAGAGAGVLHWDWTHSDDFGLLRRDGSQKVWLPALRGVAHFAREAAQFAHDVIRPEIALVLPQSLQLSASNKYSIEVQQKAVRALYNYARGSAFAAGEYQLDEMPDAKLIIVPSPWIINGEAWNSLMRKVEAGATLLVSGRVDADEHWNSILSRTIAWKAGYSSEPLRTRYVSVSWPGDSARLSYPGEATTYLDRGVLADGKTFAEIPFGEGRILYFSVPLEMSNNVDVIGRVYKFAMKEAGIREAYTTGCTDPGILIAPTRLPDATLYVLASETAGSGTVTFHDNASGKSFTVDIAPGRGVLMLVGGDGKVIASYNVK